jgi:hypothetical protein
MSKIGGGYGACRESYNTCMDQFCAAANETYRRCICSDRYRDFADMDESITQAKSMLESFVDNNLENVTLSAGEAGSKYIETEGEAAVKKDTSAAAKTLDSIDDLIEGITKPAKKTANVLDFSNLLDFDTSMDDVWSGGGGSIFGGGGGRDLSSVEGKKLYDEVNNQCASMAQSSCENQATMQMVRSAYTLLISQDCQVYEKKISSQKEQLSQKVREADRALRAARLEEFRSHNSASVNECIAKVREDVLNESACGKDYRRCLDFTGIYIDQSDLTPRYGPELFKLANVIKLGDMNAPENKTYLNELDKFKYNAKSSLDSCRDDSDRVWDLFKQQALIEIAQSQDKLLENIKSTCMSKISQCYESVGTDLTDLIDAHASLGAASHGLDRLAGKLVDRQCAETVAACANMYANPNSTGCTTATADQLMSTNNRGAGTGVTQNICGMSELLDFMAAFSGAKTEEGCRKILENKAIEACTALDGAYPWRCRVLRGGYWPDAEGKRNINGAENNPLGAIYKPVPNWTLEVLMDAGRSCLGSNATFKDLMSADGRWARDLILERWAEVKRDVAAQNKPLCENLGGFWYDRDSAEYASIEAEKCIPHDTYCILQDYIDTYIKPITNSNNDPRNAGLCAQEPYTP